MKKVKYSLPMIVIVSVIATFAFVGPTDADFEASDCSGLMGGDGKIYYTGCQASIVREVQRQL